MRDAYPVAFAAFPQFVLQKDKVPVNPHTLEHYAKGSNWQQDAGCWATAEQALARTGNGYGLGFLFTPSDPFWFIDIDKCLVDGKWSDTALEVLAMFPGCAVEVSTSGTGLHIFGSWSGPLPDHACKNTALGLEFYTRGRYVALTGTHASGDAATQADPSAFIAKYMTRATASDAPAMGWTTEPVEGYKHLEDDELLAKALRSGGAGAVFGGRATFADLWERNERVLARAYPSSTPGEAFDASSADAALAQHLAFWTGRNCERVRALMQHSGLVRDKYDREDYLIRTVEGACSRQVEVYTGPDKRREEEKRKQAELEESHELTPHTPVLTLEQMTKQLVFIGGDHAVGHMGTKRLRRKAAAADEYAASMHTYVDPDTRAERSTPAFKAWLSQRDRISVESATWWPGAPDICQPPEGHGLAFNTWMGMPAHLAPADWAERSRPFVEHVSWLCGDEHTMPFLQWLAHIVQKPAELPHTCYLHVTPTTGIGRNWVAGVLCRVLRGYVAAGVDIGKVLDGKFNGRLSKKLLATVDEVREGGDYQKRSVRGEKLKAIITEEVREIDPKYGVQTIERNCCRWLMFSQHLDALPFESNDRRIHVVNNPTERQPPEYYSRIYSLLSDESFIASVWTYLSQLDIAGFNPSAPARGGEAKRHALEAMASEVDFAVMEFIETWPGDVATLSQVREYVGDVTDQHLKNCLVRAGLAVLPVRVKLATGIRSRVVVLRGERRKWEVHPGLLGLCEEADRRFKLDQPGH